MKCLEVFDSSYVKFSFLNIDSFQWFSSIWRSNSDITLTCWRIIHFTILLTAAIFASICFNRASGLAFLLSVNFLFTRGYYISTRVKIFHIIVIFFNSVYRVEISTRDENLPIISTLVSDIDKYMPLMQSVNKLIS